LCMPKYLGQKKKAHNTGWKKKNTRKNCKTAFSAHSQKGGPVAIERGRKHTHLRTPMGKEWACFHFQEKKKGESRGGKGKTLRKGKKDLNFSHSYKCGKGRTATKSIPEEKKRGKRAVGKKRRLSQLRRERLHRRGREGSDIGDKKRGSWFQAKGKTKGKGGIFNPEGVPSIGRNERAAFCDPTTMKRRREIF